MSVRALSREHVDVRLLTKPYWESVGDEFSGHGIRIEMHPKKFMEEVIISWDG